MMASRTWLRWVGTLMVLAALLGPAAGLAQGAGTPAPEGGEVAKTQGSGWNSGGPADDAARDTVSGETMVVLAYGAIWAILLGFVMRTWFELRALRRETDELKQAIEETGPKGQAG